MIQEWRNCQDLCVMDDMNGKKKTFTSIPVPRKYSTFSNNEVLSGYCMNSRRSSGMGE